MIRSGHVPRQTAYKGPDGLSVRVHGDELHRLNAWLFEADEVLAVQLHCHPTRAYHSETDSTYPIVTALGGASVVVPDFCKDGILTSGTRIYRLSENGWIQSKPNVGDIVVVV